MIGYRLAGDARIFDSFAGGFPWFLCSHTERPLGWHSNMSCHWLLSIARAHPSVWWIPELLYSKPWHLEHDWDYPLVGIPHLGFANARRLILHCSSILYCLRLPKLNNHFMRTASLYFPSCAFSCFYPREAQMIKSMFPIIHSCDLIFDLFFFCNFYGSCSVICPFLKFLVCNLWLTGCSSVEGFQELYNWACNLFTLIEIGVNNFRELLNLIANWSITLLVYHSIIPAWLK